MNDTVKINRKNVKMVAHRGLSGIERENTCPAFVAAGNRSYFGVETDVHVTADGQFVIIHDDTTTRVSDGTVSINVEQSTWSEIETVILPDRDGTTYRHDIRVPLLAEYIHICKKYDKICVLELKNAFTKENIEKMVEEIKSLDYLHGVIFISFNFNNCVILRSLLEDNDIQWLTGDEVNVEMIEKLKTARLNLDIYHGQLNADNVKLLHDNGIMVNCWTCDNAERAEELVSMGVDFITTNILE